MNLFTLAAKLTISTAEFNAQIAKADSKGKALAEGLGNAFSKMAKAAVISLAAVGTAATAIVVKLGKTGFEYNQQMERYTTNFKVLLGSTEAAAAKVEELKRMAAKTPFVMSDLADATQTLLSFQVSADETTEILKRLGDISLGDSQKLSGLALVFGQVASAGRLSGQDLMQFINQGFNPLNEIAKRTGETMEQLRNRMSAGKITVQEVKQAMIDATSVGGMFYNGAEEGSKTVSGQWSTLKENWNAFLGKIMEPVNLEVGNSIIPALLRGLEKVSNALFGVEEDAENAKSAIFTDTNGTEIDPSANLATWFTNLLQVWSDGKPEDDAIVANFVNGFKSNTAAIVNVLQSRIDDVTGAYTDEDKANMQSQIDRLHELDGEVEELLQKRKNGLLSTSDQTRLQQALAEITAIQASVSHLTSSDVNLTKWLDSVISAFSGQGTADADAISSFVSTFNSDTELIASAIQARIDDMSGVYTDEDKRDLEAKLASLRQMQNEVNSLMEKRASGAWSEEDEQRLSALVGDITALQASLGLSADTEKALSPWEKFVSKIGGMATDGIDKLSDLIADFLSDPEAMQSALENAWTSMETIAKAAVTVANAIISIAEAVNAVIDAAKWVAEGGLGNIVPGTVENLENAAEQYVSETGDQSVTLPKLLGYGLQKRGEENPEIKEPVVQSIGSAQRRTMADILREKANSYIDEDSVFGAPMSSMSGAAFDKWMRDLGIFKGNPLDWAQGVEYADWGDTQPAEDISAISSAVDEISTTTSDHWENAATSEDIENLADNLVGGIAAAIANRPVQVYLGATELANRLAQPTRTAQAKLSRKNAIGRGK